MPDTPDTKPNPDCDLTDPRECCREACSFHSAHPVFAGGPWTIRVCPECGEHRTAFVLCEHLKGDDEGHPATARSVPVAVVPEARAAEAEQKRVELLSGIRGRNNTIDRLTAENERLREALENIRPYALAHMEQSAAEHVAAMTEHLFPKHPQDE